MAPEVGTLLAVECGTEQMVFSCGIESADLTPSTIFLQYTLEGGH